MSLVRVKALTLDTGGTLLDPPSGFRDACAEADKRHGTGREWAELAHDLRRRSLAAMLDQRRDGLPTVNIDDTHRSLPRSALR